MPTVAHENEVTGDKYHKSPAARTRFSSCRRTIEFSRVPFNKMLAGSGRQAFICCLRIKNSIGLCDLSTPPPVPTRTLISMISRPECPKAVSNLLAYQKNMKYNAMPHSAKIEPVFKPDLKSEVRNPLFYARKYESKHRLFVEVLGLQVLESTTRDAALRSRYFFQIRWQDSHCVFIPSAMAMETRSLILRAPLQSTP